MIAAKWTDDSDSNHEKFDGFRWLLCLFRLVLRIEFRVFPRGPKFILGLGLANRVKFIWKIIQPSAADSARHIRFYNGRLVILNPFLGHTKRPHFTPPKCSQLIPKLNQKALYLVHNGRRAAASRILILKMFSKNP